VRRARLFAVVVTSALTGCTGGGHPPTARIALAPQYIPVGDNYQTDVLLDGTASRNDVEDPNGLRPLGFTWSVDDPLVQIRDGALDAPKLTVRLAATGPTTVKLVVSDPGGTGRATAHVGVTIPGDM
jgi:hypothetical protein